MNGSRMKSAGTVSPVTRNCVAHQPERKCQASTGLAHPPRCQREEQSWSSWERKGCTTSGALPGPRQREANASVRMRTLAAGNDRVNRAEVLTSDQWERLEPRNSR